MDCNQPFLLKTRPNCEQLWLSFLTTILNLCITTL